MKLSPLATRKMFKPLPYLPTSIIDQTDNGPKAITTIENTTSSDNTLINERLQTFSNWPKSEILKRSLASAGFVYTGQDDVVTCPVCRVEGYHWEATDNPMEDHRTWSPNCPFLNNSQTDSTHPNRGNQDTCGLYGIEVVPNSTPANPSNLGIVTSFAADNNQMVTVESRLKTFDKWPKALKQRPQQLAEAGFYYLGMGDQTVCFSCGGGLRDWAETDDIWTQHAMWFSTCSYVILKKGPEFIAKVKNQNQPQPYSAGNSSTETKEEPADTLSESCEKISLNEGQLVEQTLCKICYKNELGVVFLPCGHIVACVDCATALKNCAVCRKPLEATVRAFLS